MLILFRPHPEQDGRDRAVHHRDVRFEPQTRAEALDALEVAVEVTDAVDPVHGLHLHQADEEVRPARRVVVKEVDDVAAALRWKKWVMVIVGLG